ncbi:MAG: hypothetical protein ACK57G_02650 [Planctomycetota bacterium]
MRASLPCILCIFALALLAPTTWSQDTPTPDAVRELEQQQRQLAVQYAKLEELFLRMSELEAASNPTRSGLLMQAAQLSKQLATQQRLLQASDLLAKGQFSRAITEQEASRENLKKLLELLQSENRSSRLKDERKRLEDILKDIRRIENIQRSTRGRTEAGQDSQSAAEDQKDIDRQLEKTEAELKPEKPEKPERSDQSDQSDQSEKSQQSEQSEKSEKSEKSEQSEQSQQSEKSEQSEQSDGKPESREQQARKRVERARKRMQQAEKKLREERRKEAVEEQQRAEEELQKAIVELERILMQLREEEIERAIVDLETRLRRMYDWEKAIRDSTEKLSALSGEAKDRQLEIQSNKLSIEQMKVAMEGQRALLLLQDEGSSQAFPEALQQVNNDAQSVVKRLVASDVSEMTLAIEDEILGALEEMLDSLKQVQKQREENKQQQGSGQQGGGGSEEQPLVDKLAELRLIKTLQLRVNRRTDRLANETSNPNDLIGQVADPRLLEELKALSDRQQKIQEVTREILLEKAKQ